MIFWIPVRDVRNFQSISRRERSLGSFTELHECFFVRVAEWKFHANQVICNFISGFSLARSPECRKQISYALDAVKIQILENPQKIETFMENEKLFLHTVTLAKVSVCRIF